MMTYYQHHTSIYPYIHTSIPPHFFLSLVNHPGNALNVQDRWNFNSWVMTRSMLVSKIYFRASH